MYNPVLLLWRASVGKSSNNVRLLFRWVKKNNTEAYCNALADPTIGMPMDVHGILLTLRSCNVAKFSTRKIVLRVLGLHPPIL